MNQIIRRKLTNNNLQSKIVQKLQIINKMHQKQEKLNYIEVVYLLNDCKIKKHLVKLYLSKQYHSNFQQINYDWQKTVKESQIVDDVVAVKRKMIEEQWIQENVNRKATQLKQQIYQEYSTSMKSREEIRQRIKYLKDEIRIIEGQISMTKKDDDSLKLRQTYKSLSMQYAFWKNQQRRMRTLNEQKLANQQVDQNKNKLDEIFQKIKETMNQQNRQQQIQSMGYHPTPRRLTIDKLSMKSKNNRIKILQRIFQQYAKKQCKQSMLFGEMLEAQHFLSLQNYLRFVNDSGVDNLLTLQEKVELFKISSEHNKTVNFIVFTEILRQICNKQCTKLKIKFSSTILDSFIEDMIRNLKQKTTNWSEKKQLQIVTSVHHSSATNNLRNKLGQQYHYKVHSHTGKYKQDIEEYLKDKKKEKEAIQALKLQLKSGMSRSNKGSQKYLNKIIQPRSRLYTYGAESTAKKNGQNSSEYLSINHPHQILIKKRSSISQIMDKDSYVGIFKKKKMANQIKLKSFINQFSTITDLIKNEQGEKLNKEHSFVNLMINQERRPKEPIRNLNPDQKEIQSIIGEQQDFFLTNHLYKNNKSKDTLKALKFHF